MKIADKSPIAKIPGAKVLLVIAPYYRSVADQLQKGAEAVAAEAEITLDRVFVPGAFEIPGAIALALKTKKFDGFIALGCVVRGETSHYDYVCGESARGLMELSLQGASVGYGILTVDSLAQAEARADPRRGDKGGEAVRACLAMIALKRRFAADAR